MKRILLSVAIVSSLFFVGCSSAEKAQNNEENIAKKIENTTNPDSLKAYVDQAKEYAAKLVSEGKVAEAQAYLDSITPIIKDKAPDLLSTLNSVAASISLDNAKAATDSTISANVDSLKAKAAEVKDAATNTVTAAADSVTSVVSNAAANAAGKVNDAAANAAGKVSDAASHATDAAKDAVNKLLH